MTIVKVDDLLERDVATLVDKVREAGPSTVEFDASVLPVEWPSTAPTRRLRGDEKLILAR